ncbi:MAG TPA: DMT family transporter [Chthoniobacterales bacterium]|nr:DMT family transporter [Chthoniobacterales bacterium]
MTNQGKANFSTGYLAVFATVMIWSTPSLFQFYLIRYYEPWSQNFYRYLAAFLAVLPFVFVRFRVAGGRLDGRAFLACLIPSLPNVVHQISQTVALYHMGPGVYAIFGRSSVIFTALLALLFFPEERQIIRQWQFQVGTALGLLGAVGVVCFQEGWKAGKVPVAGFVIATTASLCWASYSVLVKRPSALLGPIRSFGVVSFITTLLLLPLTVAFGKIETPLRVGAGVNIILIISAVTCISLAHVLYYVAIRRVGVALSQTLQLICPAGALGLSAYFFGERLTQAQLWSAALLLFGAFLAMRVKPGADPTALEEV